MATFGAIGSTTRKDYLKRLRRVYGLDRDALIDNGYLDSLLVDLESHDSAFGTDEVSEVLTLLEEIEDLTELIRANESGAALGATMISVQGEISLQYSQQGGMKGDLYNRGLRDTKKTQLLASLDQRDVLQGHIQYSKVISG